MRRRGRRLGSVVAVALVGLSGIGAEIGVVAPRAAATAAPTAPTVLVGCLGVDAGATGPQIRVGFVTSGPDGLYRAVFAGPSGPVQGEGRVAGGRGLVIVPSTGPGDYGDLVLTDVDTGQSVDRGPLGDELPFAVGEEAVTCDPAALVVSTGETTPPTAPPTESTVAPTVDPTGVPTPDISTASPVPATTASTASTSDTPPWLLLVIPGVLLAGGGVFLLVKGRSDSRSRPAT